MKKRISLRFCMQYAGKSLYRDKRSLLILILSAVCSYFILFAALLGIYTQYRGQAVRVRNTTGNWHVAFLTTAQDAGTAAAHLTEHPNVENVVQSFSVTGRSVPNVEESVNIIGLDRFDGFLPLCSGAFPQRQNEILVPQWFTEKYQIKDSSVTINGVQFSITGQYPSDYFINAGRLVFYTSFAHNQLAEEGTDFLPFADMPRTLDGETNARILLVSLKEKTDLRLFLRSLDYSGYAPFHAREAYGISVTEEEETPAFNGALISAEHFKNGGMLTDSGYFAAKRKMDTAVIALVLLFTAISCVFYFNRKKGELKKTLGIIRVVGFDSNALVVLQLFSALGISFIYTTAGVLLYLLTNGLFHIILPVSVLVAPLLLNVIVIFLMSATYAVIVDVKSPVESMNCTTYTTSVKRASIAGERLLRSKSRLGFAVRFSLRNSRLNKKRVFLASVSMFAVFSISIFFIVQLIWNMENSGQKNRWQYDYLLKTDSTETSRELLSEISAEQEFGKITVPLVFKENHVESPKTPWILTTVDKRYLSDYLKQTLLFTDLPSNIENERPEAVFSSGVLGFSDNDLSVMEPYVLEGSIASVQKNDNYIIIPRYAKECVTQNIELTSLKVGDTIKVGLTNFMSYGAAPSLYQEKEYVIGAVVSAIPFEAYNGNSNQFSIIMNENAFSALCPSVSIPQIMINCLPEDFSLVRTKLEQMQETYAFSILDKNQNEFLAKREAARQVSQSRLILSAGVTLCTIVCGALFQFIWVQNKQRRKEFVLLRLSGFRTSTIILQSFIDTLFPFAVGFAASLYFTHRFFQKIDRQLSISLQYIIPLRIYVVLAGAVLLLVVIFHLLSHLKLGVTIK